LNKNNFREIQSEVSTQLREKRLYRVSLDRSLRTYMRNKYHLQTVFQYFFCWFFVCHCVSFMFLLSFSLSSGFLSVFYVSSVLLLCYFCVSSVLLLCFFCVTLVFLRCYFYVSFSPLYFFYISSLLLLFSSASFCFSSVLLLFSTFFFRVSFYSSSSLLFLLTFEKIF
jgi:hypothetical protein